MSYARTADRITSPGSGIGSRYRALLLTHQSLDEKLSAELRRPMPDAAVIQRLKRRKLLIKDEVAAIERLFDAIDAPIGGETTMRRRSTKAPASAKRVRKMSAGKSRVRRSGARFVAEAGL